VVGSTVLCEYTTFLDAVRYPSYGGGCDEGCGILSSFGLRVGSFGLDWMRCEKW
jgi:hypothetical protein